MILTETIAQEAWELYENGQALMVVERLAPFQSELRSEPELCVAYADSLRQIRRYRDAKDFAESVFPITDAERQFDLLVVLSESLKELGQHIEASTYYELAINQSLPNVPGWLYVLYGTNLIQQQQFRKAVIAFESARSLQQVDIDEVDMNLSYAYLALGDRARALMYARNVISERTSDLHQQATCVLESLGEPRATKWVRRL